MQSQTDKFRELLEIAAGFAEIYGGGTPGFEEGGGVPDMAGIAAHEFVGSLTAEEAMGRKWFTIKRGSIEFS